jgi:Hemerythrin HHE cation binding domain/Global regulator protein family
MPQQVLRVGDTLVLDEDIRLTVLAVEGDSVVLGVTAPGPPAPGGAAEVGRRQPPRPRPTPAPLPREHGPPAAGGAARRPLTDEAGPPGRQGAVTTQQTLQEHALVQTLTEALRLTAGRGAEGDAHPPSLSALRFLARSFQRHLERLLALEEGDGYLDLVVRTSPWLSRAAEALRRDHEHLRRGARRLAHRLEHLPPTHPLALAWVGDHVLALLDGFDEHNDKEGGGVIANGIFPNDDDSLSRPAPRPRAVRWPSRRR